MKGWFVAAIVLGTHALLIGQRTDVILAADLRTHLNPIARFDGSTWRAIPEAGLGQLAPRQWTRWYAPGPSLAIRLAVAEPTGRCSLPRWLPVANPPAAPAGLFDRKYVGISATGALVVDRLRRVTDAAKEWKSIATAVTAQFERRAKTAGVSAASLAGVPMTVDWVFAAGSGAEAPTYYFEASKRIPDAGDTPLEDPKGIVNVIVSGWLREEDERFVPAGTKVELLWTPEDDVTTERPGLVPLGVLRQGNDRVWVMAARIGMRERFTLYGAGDGIVRALVTVDAAAC
jgi:hypothetical protein